MAKVANQIVLAGDIGGTKTLLKLAEVDNLGHLRSIRERRYASCAYPGLEFIIADFLEGEKPTSACFGVAGPVKDNTSKITHLPWFIVASYISEEFGIRTVKLINDFEAVAYGIESLEQKDLCVLNEGKPQQHGVRAVIGAGTSLGEGILVWQNDHYEPLPSEGGNADFAPRGCLQTALYTELSEYEPYVPYGRVLSGRGLVSIYEFHLRRGGYDESRELALDMRSSDPAHAISQYALQHKDPLASAALSMFIDIYGAETGNLALRTLPAGGIYVAGGIAPQIISKLVDGDFMRAFADKGPFHALLLDIPVSVILCHEVGLLGAARYAARYVAAREC